MNLDSEKLNHLIVRQLRHCAIFTIDTAGVLRSWNEGVYHLLGYTEDEFIGRPASMIYLGQDVQAGVPEQEIQTAIADGHSSDTRWHLRKDGSTFYCDGIVSALRDPQGELIGVTKIMRDATDQARMEQRSAHLSALVEWSHDAIFSATPDGMLTTWNPAAERLFGYSAAEIVGKPITVLTPDERVDEPRDFMQRVADGKPVVGIETVRKTKDGRLLDIDVTLSPIRDKSGQIISYSAILRDDSERRGAGRALRKSEELLAAKARELQRSNEELQAFAYTASHDLQEPIRTVVSLTQLLARKYSGEFGKEGDQMMSLILEAANRMSKLIASLLEYSRVDAEYELPGTPVDMEQVLRQTCRVLDFSIRDSEAVITHDPLPKIRGDEHQIVQLVQNLLSNSLKYRKPDEIPRIHIGAVPVNEYWKITVTDNGLGFDPQYSERIFGLFKRLHGRRYSGTGIGLAICKKIVEAHGGRMWAESAGEGAGASFHLLLPRADV